MLDHGRGVLDRIEHRHEVGGLLGRAVDQAVGIEARVALVGRDGVMEIDFRLRPVPYADHDIALDALGPLGLGERQLARRCGRSIGIERRYGRAEPIVRRHVVATPDWTRALPQSVLEGAKLRRRWRMPFDECVAGLTGIFTVSIRSSATS
jgi:hypothetical protein